MNRLYRLVVTQNGTLHISAVIQPEEEARESLQAEVELHRMFGWEVKEADGDYVCIRGDIERRVGMREEKRP